MKKQELIEKYKNKCLVTTRFESMEMFRELWKDIKQLDEPEKVVVPQKVAEYIEQTKNEDYHLLGAMTEIRSHKNKEIDDWFYTDDNMELFARAWLDGYEVEKEKRYLVKMKNMSKKMDCLAFKFGHIWVFRSSEENEEYRTRHTREELEEAGFGWVFDCPGIEVEEVI